MLSVLCQVIVHSPSCDDSTKRPTPGFSQCPRGRSTPIVDAVHGTYQHDCDFNDTLREILNPSSVTMSVLNIDSVFVTFNMVYCDLTMAQVRG